MMRQSQGVTQGGKDFHAGQLITALTCKQLQNEREAPFLTFHRSFPIITQHRSAILIILRR
jgi:hypothetical protein